MQRRDQRAAHLAQFLGERILHPDRLARRDAGELVVIGDRGEREGIHFGEARALHDLARAAEEFALAIRRRIGEATRRKLGGNVFEAGQPRNLLGEIGGLIQIGSIWRRHHAQEVFSLRAFLDRRAEREQAAADLGRGNLDAEQRRELFRIERDLARRSGTNIVVDDWSHPRGRCAI